MVCCVHHIPGRARFKIGALRRNPELADSIEDKLAALPGVSAVEINRPAASVVVHYCPETGEVEKIKDHICAHCPKTAPSRGAADRAAPRSRPSRSSRPALGAGINAKFTRAMGEAVSKAVLNALISRTLDHGMAGMLIGRR